MDISAVATSTNPLGAIVAGGLSSPGMIWKSFLSLVLSAAGMYQLSQGKKQGDGGKMLTGAGLILASFFCF